MENENSVTTRSENQVEVISVKSLKDEMVKQGMDPTELVRRLIKCIEGVNTSVLKDGTVKGYYDAKIALRAIELGMEVFADKFKPGEQPTEDLVGMFITEIKQLKDESEPGRTKSS
jgi:hypothetical protein